MDMNFPHRGRAYPLQGNCGSADLTAISLDTLVARLTVNVARAQVHAEWLNDSSCAAADPLNARIMLLANGIRSQAAYGSFHQKAADSLSQIRDEHNYEQPVYLDHLGNGKTQAVEGVVQANRPLQHGEDTDD